MSKFAKDSPNIFSWLQAVMTIQLVVVVFTHGFVEKRKEIADKNSKFRIRFLNYLFDDTKPLYIDVKEYCQFDSFKVRCDIDEVILMDSAKYGRIRTGQCLRGEGYIGCISDVMQYMDTVCSGRRQCDVSVASLAEIFHPCKRDYTSYLEASYKCIKVASSNEEVCLSPIRLSSKHGYISSLLAYDRNYGIHDCPWILQGRPGQKIEIKASVFGRPSSFSNTGQDIKLPKETQRGCKSSVVMEDGDGLRHKDFPLCGSGKRNQVIYTSTSSKMQIYFVLNYKGDERPSFLLEYTIIGCPDLTRPAPAQIKRTGDNIVIRCNQTMETWYLTCRNNEWIGELGNCTYILSPENSAKEIALIPFLHKLSKRMRHALGPDIPFPQGLIIAIILGVLLGILIGSTSLGILYTVRRRKQRQQNARANVEAEVSQRLSASDIERDSIYKQESGYGSKSTNYAVRQPQYGRKPNQQPPNPPVYPTAVTYGRKGHVYETPRTEAGHDGKLYFELDPDTAPRSKST